MSAQTPEEPADGEPSEKEGAHERAGLPLADKHLTMNTTTAPTTPRIGTSSTTAQERRLAALSKVYDFLLKRPAAATKQRRES